MSILGVVVRTHPASVSMITARLGALPGVDVALNPGDGRIVIVIEDLSPGDQAADAPPSAAATLGAIAVWPEVLGTSLVYEYSGPDAPAPEGTDGIDYRAWRDGLTPTTASTRHAER